MNRTSTSPDPGTGPSTSESRSSYLPVNGLTYHCLEWGRPDAPVLLALHGLRSYAATFTGVAHALATKYRVVAPDFRGRGDSSWDPERNYFTSSYVSDIEQLTASLGVDRFTLLGHSMGGTVGYAYAARHPQQVRALVVEDIGPGSSTATAGADRILRELEQTPTRFADRAAVARFWRGIRPDVTEEALASRIDNTVRKADEQWVWKLDMEGVAAARRSGDPAGPIDLWACVESLQCPTLVVRGSRSDFLTPQICRELAARQPRLTSVEIPDAGHYVHDDNPAAFLRAVTSFLDRADTEGRAGAG